MTLETDILRKNEVFTSDCKASNAISFPNVLIRFSSFYHAIRKLLCRMCTKVEDLLYIVYIVSFRGIFKYKPCFSSSFIFWGKNMNTGILKKIHKHVRLLRHFEMIRITFFGQGVSNLNDF
jgi:hypothetical protein